MVSYKIMEDYQKNFHNFVNGLINFIKQLNKSEIFDGLISFELSNGNIVTIRHDDMVLFFDKYLVVLFRGRADAPYLIYSYVDIVGIKALGEIKEME